MSEPCSASLVILAEVLGGAGLDHVMHAYRMDPGTPVRDIITH